MVRVVSRIPDGHVLEQSVICSNGVIRLVLDLLSTPSHSPRAPILKPCLMPLEEVHAHVQ